MDKRKLTSTKPPGTPAKEPGTPTIRIRKRRPHSVFIQNTFHKTFFRPPSQVLLNNPVLNGGNVSIRPIQEAPTRRTIFLNTQQSQTVAERANPRFNAGIRRAKKHVRRMVAKRKKEQKTDQQITARINDRNFNKALTVGTWTPPTTTSKEPKQV
jgi:hypothetical protein